MKLTINPEGKLRKEELEFFEKLKNSNRRIYFSNHDYYEKELDLEQFLSCLQKLSDQFQSKIYNLLYFLRSPLIIDSLDHLDRREEREKMSPQLRAFYEKNKVRIAKINGAYQNLSALKRYCSIHKIFDGVDGFESFDDLVDLDFFKATSDKIMKYNKHTLPEKIKIALELDKIILGIIKKLESKN